MDKPNGTHNKARREKRTSSTRKQKHQPKLTRKQHATQCSNGGVLPGKVATEQRGGFGFFSRKVGSGNQKNVRRGKFGTLKNWFRTRILRRKPDASPMVMKPGPVSKANATGIYAPLMPRYVTFSVSNDDYEFVENGPEYIRLLPSVGNLASSIIPFTTKQNNDDLDLIIAKYIAANKGKPFKMYIKKSQAGTGDAIFEVKYPKETNRNKTDILIVSLNPYYYLHYEENPDLDLVNRCLAQLGNVGGDGQLLHVIPISELVASGSSGMNIRGLKTQWAFGGVADRLLQANPSTKYVILTEDDTQQQQPPKRYVVYCDGGNQKCGDIKQIPLVDYLDGKINKPDGAKYVIGYRLH